MAAILRSDDMRRQNRLRILQIVRRCGPISRSAIALTASLSPATVSTISNDLIAEGILVSAGQDPAAATGRGRPSVDLSINPDFCRAVLLILKVGVVTVAVVDYAGGLIRRREFALDMARIGKDAFRDAIIAHVRETLNDAETGKVQLARISVGVQGVTDSAAKRILWSPMTPLTELPVAQWLETDFAVPVRVSNDCNLIARAMSWRQSDNESGNFAVILLAHGVGMGLFLRGQVVSGTRSSGTEFGHMMYRPNGALCRCGSRGCIEAYSGDYAIMRRFRGEPDDTEPDGSVDPADITAIAQAARRGDPKARDAFASAGRAIASGLAGMFALVDPFRVALVGHGATAFDLMEPALRETLGTSNASFAKNIPIELCPEEMPLILDGCSIDALSEIDAGQADRMVELAKA
jgi:predicted NBD/HSP70 family sugar kinase